MSANIAERGKAGPEREVFAVPSAIQTEFQELWNIPKIPVKLSGLKALGQAKQVKFTTPPKVDFNLPSHCTRSPHLPNDLPPVEHHFVSLAEPVLRHVWLELFWKRGASCQKPQQLCANGKKTEHGLQSSCGSCLQSCKLLWPKFGIETNTRHLIIQLWSATPD